MLYLRVALISLLFATWGVALAATQDDAGPVVASLNGQPVYVRDVERLVREAIQDREVSLEEREALAKQSLEQLVSRRLILARLTREGAGATSEEVERASQSLAERAAREKQTFDQWLKQNGFTAASLREEVAWRIAWRRYLEMHATDAAIEQYFTQHRRHWDGSQVRARHILWKLDRARDSAAQQAALQQAQQVRRQIAAAEITFSQAAQQHSAAPSRDVGGDLGFLPRHGVMDEVFSLALFELEPAEISQPIVTPFGVHLVQCVEIRPGKKTWRDCREELHRAVAQQLFDRLAAAERRGATIRYPAAEERSAK